MPTLTTRIVARIVLVVLAIALVVTVLTVRSCQQGRTAKTETKLANGRSAAAIASGGDAVDTIGNVQAAETATRTNVREGQDAIANAPAGDSNAAADRAACELRSYRRSSRCVELLGPVAE